MTEMTMEKAHDVARWDVLDGLEERLIGLAEEVAALRDDLAPPKLTMIDAADHARQVREYFDALDAIGWYSPEQMAAAS